MHRGYEKLTEVRTFPQVTTLINRIDWLGSFANEVPFILAAEKLMEIEAPPRAQWIRTILFELSPHRQRRRCSSATSACSSARVTPVFYAFRDREYVLNLIESGHRRSLPPELRPHRRPQGRPARRAGSTRPRRSWARSAAFCDEMEDLLVGNEIFQTRTRGIGVIPPDVALAYGLSGANLRAAASTGTCAATSDLPMAWDKVDWKVWTHPDGDCFARCWVRLQEVREATKIVDQLLDGCRAGPIMAKVPRIIKVPEGEAWVSTENPLGEMGYYVVSKGDLGPFRVKIRSAQLQQHLDRAVGAAGRVRPRRHHDPRQPLLHPRGHRPVMHSPLLGESSPPTSPTGGSRSCASSVASSPCCSRPARSSTSSCSR